MTCRLVTLLAVSATAALMAAALPETAGAAGKVNCAKLNGKPLLRAILKQRCAGPFRAEGGAKVKVGIKGTQVTDWSDHSENHLHLGTDKECHIVYDGSGRQTVAFSTRAVTGYLFSSDRRTLRLEAAAGLRGSVTRVGTRRDTTAGPGCASEENVADTSGCKTAGMAGGGHAIGAYYERGRLKLRSAGFGRISDRIDPCPFHGGTLWGDRFISDGKGLSDPVKVAPAALLKRRAVSVNGTDSDVQHKDCNTDGPCRQGISFRDDVATTLRWKVTIKR